MKRSVNFSRLKPATLRRKLMSAEELQGWIDDQKRKAEAKKANEVFTPPPEERKKEHG